MNFLYKNIDNFCPINLLWVFAYLLERIILNQFLPFLEKDNVINNEQFGLWKYLSMIDAVAI